VPRAVLTERLETLREAGVLAELSKTLTTPHRLLEPIRGH
jgi:hypothetical protein